MASRVSAACIFALALLIAPLAGTNGNFVADWSFKGPDAERMAAARPGRLAR
jgi:hypothetical protein